MPVVETVAIVLLLLIQAPPVVVSVNVVVLLTHTDEEPVMAPITGVGLMVTDFVAYAVAQLLVTPYEIVTDPPDTPTTRPDADTVATAVLLLLHVPPETVSVNVDGVPAQKALAPVIVPAEAPVITVMP